MTFLRGVFGSLLYRARSRAAPTRYALTLYERQPGRFAVHILDTEGRRVDGFHAERMAILRTWTLWNYPLAVAVPQGERCPLCGRSTRVGGRTLDGRLLAVCGDAFTLQQWMAQWAR